MPIFLLLTSGHNLQDLPNEDLELIHGNLSIIVSIKLLQNIEDFLIIRFVNTNIISNVHHHSLKLITIQMPISICIDFIECCLCELFQFWWIIKDSSNLMRLESSCHLLSKMYI